VAAHTRAWRLRSWSELDEATRARWRERLEPDEDYFAVRNLVEAYAVLLLELEETADAPLQIHYRHGAGWVQPLLLVEVAAGARGAIVETFASFGPSTQNGAVNLWLGEGAELTHGVFTAKAQEALLHRVRARLGARARLDVQSFAATRGYQRLEWDVALGESAALRLSGITHGEPDGSTDVALRIRHAAPGAATDVRWRGLVPAEAHSAVIGRILIEPAGQRTDAAMRLDHLLLADGAAADVKPELEIYADDVACGHGATLGRLDDEALFYLRSRGIPEVEARQLLIDAFLAPVLQRFTLAEVLRHVHSRLPLPDDAAA
jgi:Fe-S cluster assembly protein SufD